MYEIRIPPAIAGIKCTFHFPQICATISWCPKIMKMKRLMTIFSTHKQTYVILVRKLCPINVFFSIRKDFTISSKLSPRYTISNVSILNIWQIGFLWKEMTNVHLQEILPIALHTTNVKYRCLIVCSSKFKKTGKSILILKIEWWWWFIRNNFQWAFYDDFYLSSSTKPIVCDMCEHNKSLVMTVSAFIFKIKDFFFSFLVIITCIYHSMKYFQ